MGPGGLAAVMEASDWLSECDDLGPDGLAFAPEKSQRVRQQRLAARLLAELQFPSCRPPCPLCRLLLHVLVEQTDRGGRLGERVRRAAFC